MELQDLQGKVGFIAGGTSGINLGIAKKLRESGVKLAVLGRDLEKAKNAALSLSEDEGLAIGLSGDVRDYEAMEAALAKTTEHFGGPLDIVISGAAGNFVCPASKLSPGGFKAVVDIDLVGTFNVFRSSYESLNPNGASLIAITAPQAEAPYQFQAHACAAKAGVNMLTKCLALEWGRKGIRVNGISPGPIADTEGVSRLLAQAGEEYVQSLALKRLGTKDEVASLALFLCSEQASYITGSIFSCDGGSSLGSHSFTGRARPQMGGESAAQDPS